MSNLTISLTPTFTSQPPHCKIYCSDDLIYDSIISEKVNINHNFDFNRKFVIKIIKTGKTMDIVKKHHEQVIQINDIKLNGINLKSKELGKFKIKNNPFIDDHTLSTDLLTLNGDWQLELPFIPLVGTTAPYYNDNSLDIRKIQTEIRDEIENCNIACFGCSQTRGFFPEDEEAWPYHLGKILNTKVKNFGINGSNINQITAFVEEYLNNGYKANLIIILIPHTFRRQITIENKTINVQSHGKENKELHNHGEEHSVATISGSLEKWVDSLSKKAKILIGIYQSNEHNLFKITPLKKVMLPFLNDNAYPKAPDGLHFGKEYCKEYAKTLKNFLIKNNIDY
jgi:hypothetical protein